MSRFLNLKALAGVGSLVLLAAVYLGAVAEDPANQHFFGVWQRTDQPVRDGQVSRTWMWGPEAFTTSLFEPYAESPGGQREVQYFDKSRMEITQPTNGDPTSIWYVTNGLLVNELMTGQMQVGDNAFEQHSPAEVNIAGDADDVLGPTYGALANLRAAPPLPDGSVITQTVDRIGSVGNDASTAQYNVTAAQRVQQPGIDHQIASPFWEFMNSSGVVVENSETIVAPLFVNPFFATGFPVTEAYWSNIKVGGTVQPVLLQCFERRCLTYTPANAPQWRVEQGNVGQHYYAWRYEQDMATPTATEPDTTSTATEPAPTATSTTAAIPTVTVTATMVPPSNYVYTSKFGLPSDETRRLDSPDDVALDPNGNIYVTDWGNSRVMKFDPNGVYLTQWGAFGTNNGQFSALWGIAVGQTANGLRVYVADLGNDRIQIFDANGMFIDTFGNSGAGPGQFDGPVDVGVDAAGNLYVADRFNQRIQKFNAVGTYLYEWDGSDGVLAFEDPMSVHVGPDDTVYVVDHARDRIQVFDTNGTYVRSWGNSGAGNNQIDGPVDIVVNADNNRTYVTDSGNNRIQIFDTQGNHVTQWGGLPTGDGQGQFGSPWGITLDQNGDLLVVDWPNDRLQIFSSDDFSYLGQITGDSRGRLRVPTGVTLDQSGNFIVVDNMLNQVKLFTSSGEYVSEWGDFGTHVPPDTPLQGPFDSAVDSQGAIFVTDYFNDRVVKYNAQGEQLLSWGDSGSGNGQFSGVLGIAVDANDNVYVADDFNYRVQKFNSTGGFITAWELQSSSPGTPDRPAGIAVSGSSLYVTGEDNVQEYDLNGNFVRSWGSSGSGDGQFDNPAGIAIDSAGYIYVVDVLNQRIQKFTPTGEYYAQFGTGGTGNGQFSNPHGIEIDAAGNVIVADTYNSRVQIFSPTS